MKRTLVALSLAVLAAPVFAVEVSAPYEQAQVDRVLPNVTQKSDRASTGSTQKEGNNPWANDWNFIAPSMSPDVLGQPGGQAAVRPFRLNGGT